MSDPNPADQPEPTQDAPPDSAPGGPADRVQRDGELPPVIPDQPRSAQVAEGEVPDAVEQPDEPDEEETDVDDSTKEPS
jgi:hypothetical protein